MIIGAIANMGMVWLVMIQGIRDLSMARFSTIETARPMPRIVPIAKPSSVEDRVTLPWKMSERFEVIFFFDCRFPDFAHNLVRRRQDRAFLRHRIADKVFHLPLDAGLLIPVDLPGRIEINGEAVPDDHDGGHHSGDRDQP